MSNQPSTMDTIRSTAVSATQTAVETLDPSQNQGGDKTASSSMRDFRDSSSDKSYKQQLDEAAYNYKPPEEEEKKETLVEKVMSHIPEMSSTNKSRPESSSEGQLKDGDTNPKTMPKRPEHDLQVEEFLKEQYKSRSGADMSSVGEGN